MKRLLFITLLVIFSTSSVAIAKKHCPTRSEILFMLGNTKRQTFQQLRRRSCQQLRKPRICRISYQAWLATTPEARRLFAKARKCRRGKKAKRGKTGHFVRPRKRGKRGKKGRNKVKRINRRRCPRIRRPVCRRGVVKFIRFGPNRCPRYICVRKKRRR